MDQTPLTESGIALDRRRFLAAASMLGVDASLDRGRARYAGPG